MSICRARLRNTSTALTFWMSGKQTPLQVAWKMVWTVSGGRPCCLSVRRANRVHAQLVCSSVMCWNRKFPTNRHSKCLDELDACETRNCQRWDWHCHSTSWPDKNDLCWLDTVKFEIIAKRKDAHSCGLFKILFAHNSDNNKSVVPTPHTLVGN